MSLLHLTPAVAAAERVVESLLCVPGVPHCTAIHIVTAGVRVSYAQLLGAANNMVQGVEVWAQAQQQLGIETDTPAAAVTICCYDCTTFTAWVGYTSPHW